MICYLGDEKALGNLKEAHTQNSLVKKSIAKKRSFQVGFRFKLLIIYILTSSL